MISAWTKHLKEQAEKDRFSNEILGSKRVLERLTTLLDELKDEADNSELDVKNYDVSNWAYLQADRNGYKRALKIIKRIIDLTDQKESK